MGGKACTTCRMNDGAEEVVANTYSMLNHPMTVVRSQRPEKVEMDSHRLLSFPLQFSRLDHLDDRFMRMLQPYKRPRCCPATPILGCKEPWTPEQVPCSCSSVVT